MPLTWRLLQAEQLDRLTLPAAGNTRGNLDWVYISLRVLDKEGEAERLYFAAK
ncbi:hypothetical protein D3C76_1826740 [compost metagenome]